MARQLPSFVRSSTFRLSFFYVLAIATIDDQTEQSTKADAASLIQEYSSQGIAGLIEAVEDRVSPDRAGDGLYMLEDEDGRPLAPNIHRWPNVEPDHRAWISV